MLEVKPKKKQSMIHSFFGSIFGTSSGANQSRYQEAAADPDDVVLDKPTPVGSHFIVMKKEDEVAVAPATVKTLPEGRNDTSIPLKESDMKRSHAHLGISLVKALEELRLTKGNEAAHEFSSIFTHHFNHVKDPSYNLKEEEMKDDQSLSLIIDTFTNKK